MEKTEIIDIYSIETINGVLVLNKEDIDEWTKCKKYRGYHYPNVLINPNIDILDNGVLKISGSIHSLASVRNVDDYNPKPISELDPSWGDIVFYDVADIVNRPVVEWKGMWPFRRKITHKNVPHLLSGYYLRTVGVMETQLVSNYKVIGFNEAPRPKFL